MNFKPAHLQSGIRLLRANVVLPVSQPPIEDGAVALSGNKIVAVGRWTDIKEMFPGEVTDLGEVILLPGLVNAHCHLDYTAMARLIPPQKHFVDWLQLITTNKGDWIYSDFAASWLAGAGMLLRTGTTTVGDIEMAPELLPEVWTATPLRVHSFIEMTGVKSRRPPVEIIGEALDKIAAVNIGHCRIGLSPHAPYSTTPALLRLAAQVSRKHKLRVVTHVAESIEEFEMFCDGAGKMHTWLARGGRDMTDCGFVSPVRHMHQNGLLGENFLAVHVNYLAPGDASLLGESRSSVVHCPRSHAYFKHRPFPADQLSGAGVNLCLGTDSLASVHLPRRQKPELNLFDEMRQFADINPYASAATILEMATRNGAIALGRRGEIGELTPGALADLITIPFEGKKADAYDTAVQHRGPVSSSMIDGRWAIAPENQTPRS